jgi:DNA-directed RNA polymerase
MQEFSPIDYIRIDIANQYGMDKESWDTRINWVNDNEKVLNTLISVADKPLLFEKGINALSDAKKGIATGFAMSLDSTSSGLQCFAVLTGCVVTAENTNVISTGKREDIYDKIAKNMNLLPNVDVCRADTKKPVMTTLYGSKKQPENLFGKDTPELSAFYQALHTELPGAMEALEDIQSCWDPMALDYQWHLPDGFRVVAKVMAPVDKKIEVQEYSKATFTHRAIMNIPQNRGRSLAANVIHSVDSYLCREMIRRCNFDLYTVHDAYFASPNNMQVVRETYVEIMTEISASDLFSSIFSEVRGISTKFKKFTHDMSAKVANAEYMLS